MKEKQIKEFIEFLETNSPIQLTVQKIRQDFFNNNNDFASKALKFLKQEGFVYSNNSWCKGKGQIWYILNTEKDLDVAIGNSGICGRNKSTATCRELDADKNTASCRELSIHYRGFKEMTIFVSKDDFKIVRDAEEKLKDFMSEDLFIDYLQTFGFSKEKAWFYYTKIKKPVQQ